MRARDLAEGEERSTRPVVIEQREQHADARFDAALERGLRGATRGRLKDFSVKVFLDVNAQRIQHDRCLRKAVGFQREESAEARPGGRTASSWSCGRRGRSGTTRR